MPDGPHGSSAALPKTVMKFDVPALGLPAQKATRGFRDRLSVAAEQGADLPIAPRPRTVAAVRDDVPLIAATSKPSRVAALALSVPLATGIILSWTLRTQPLALWLALIGCVVAFFVLLGRSLSGHWFGILVGRSNTLSLSIAQSLLWSSLVFPALIAAFANRLATNPSDALAIGFDAQLATLVGIPVVGLAGARIITSGKAGNGRPVKDETDCALAYVDAHLDTFWNDYVAHHTAAPGDAPLRTAPTLPSTIPPATRRGVPGQLRQILEDRRRASSQVRGDATLQMPVIDTSVPLTSQANFAATLAGPEAFALWLSEYLRQGRRGVLVRNLHASEASVRDLIEGDELGDEGATDFGKAQFLLVTLIALAAYAAALAWMFTHPTAGCGTAAIPATLSKPAVPANPCITTLPHLSDAVPALLLSSLVGYLGFKAAPSTPTE